MGNSCATAKPFYKSKKAMFATMLVALTFGYFYWLFSVDAPWEAHESPWTFLSTLVLAYLGSQAVPDAAKAYAN